MKKSRLSAKHSRLFAVLMRDECHERYINDGHFAYYEYLHFLRAQANHSDANCPYRRAVAMVEGRA